MKLWQSSRAPRDLLAYLGHNGVGYTLRKHCIERYERNADGRYVFAGFRGDAPPEVVAHWRRLGGMLPGFVNLLEGYAALEQTGVLDDLDDTPACSYCDAAA